LVDDNNTETIDETMVEAITSDRELGTFSIVEMHQFLDSILIIDNVDGCQRRLL